MEASSEICKLFTCPICYSIMVPPIVMCELGHSFCGSCFINIDKCPKCRQSLGFLRNVVVERLQMNFIFPCPNEDDGCDFRSTSIVLKRHELFCDFSLINCELKLDNCNWNGVRHKMLSHSLQHHPTNTAVTSTQSFLWTTPECDSVCKILFNSFGKQFLLFLHFVNFENINLFVLYLGVPKDAKKFYFTVTFESIENNNCRRRFRRKCHSANKCLLSHNDTTHLFINLKLIFGDYHDGKGFYYTISLDNYNMSTKGKGRQPNQLELTSNVICPTWCRRERANASVRFPDGYTDKKVIAMWDEALRQCSKVLWENCVNHTENLIKNWYECEKLLDVSVNELIIRVDQGNDSSSESSDTD
ncbi:hypothetical protein FQA39_LY09285 [Lamprigera yunnana]|nr:hypothetical protein FQA39_LY09285 [Lamprigera yunnana]